MFFVFMLANGNQKLARKLDFEMFHVFNCFKIIDININPINII